MSVGENGKLVVRHTPLATSFEVMEILKEINKEGITLIIVTHEHDIAQMTKRIVHLKDGVIIDDAPVKQVRASLYV